MLVAGFSATVVPHLNLFPVVLGYLDVHGMLVRIFQPKRSRTLDATASQRLQTNANTMRCSCFTICSQVGQTNIERRAYREEKHVARRTLVPVLQAEEDRRWLVLAVPTSCLPFHM